MDLLKEIQNSKLIIQSTIDMLGAHQSTLAKARQENKDLIMADIIKFDGRSGKPSIAKKKRL